MGRVRDSVAQVCAWVEGASPPRCGEQGPWKPADMAPRLRASGTCLHELTGTLVGLRRNAALGAVGWLYHVKPGFLFISITKPGEQGPDAGEATLSPRE